MSVTAVFAPISVHGPGTIRELLSRSYEEPVVAGRLDRILPSAKWPAFDADFFDNLHSPGRDAFVTSLAGQPIGFASWDLRCAPEHGVIGHNCILPEYRGRGYGKRQIQEVLSRFRQAGVRRAMVLTGDDPFFVPAQRMYLSCGFVRVFRVPCRPDLTYDTIRYEIDLTEPAVQGPDPAATDVPDFML